MKKTNPVSNQHGFTLIEIIAVLIILGILAAVGVPKFLDLTEEAEQGAVNAQAANLSSGSSINFAKYKLTEGAEGIDVTGCAGAASLVEDWDDKFSLTDTSATAGSLSARFTLLRPQGTPPPQTCYVYIPQD
jgi:MSHA pilin protein MshA